MSDIIIDKYIKADVAPTTFTATPEETYFIWVKEHGEKEAARLWKRCRGNKALPRAKQ